MSFAVICFSRVDHLYTFFVEWSPAIYKKGNKKHTQPRYLIREKLQNRYLVVEKDKVAVINKLLSNPANSSAKNWEVSFCENNTILHETKALWVQEVYSVLMQFKHSKMEIIKSLQVTVTEAVKCLAVVP